MPEKFKVLVTDKISREGLKPLDDHPDIELEMALKAAPDKLDALVPDAQAWLVRSETKITAQWLEKARSLRLVGRAGVGVDNIDVSEASRRGVAVVNAPAANTISACEHTCGLLLALSRNIPQADRDVKEGRWQKAKWMGVELAGKTLGLVGLGRIGAEVAKRAKSFGMNILAYDPFISEKQAEALGVEILELKELLGRADYVSLHVPSTDKTKGMINRETLAWFKKGARLINCARGDLIDEEALVASLRSGALTGAGLDVFKPEPLREESELRKLPQVILTPHLGASTAEAQLKVAEDLARSVLDFYSKGIVRNAINLPGFDPDTLEALGPSIELSRLLGSFLGQILDSGLKAVRCRFQGAFEPAQRHPLAVAALKGVLSSILDRSVSFINAPLLASERGIETSESAAPPAQGYARLLTVTAVTDRGERSVSGNVGEGGEPRIVLLDELHIDLCPRGRMLVLTNRDEPGVIGKVGTLLGRHRVNIADMRVGRHDKHGEAVMVVSVDEDLKPEAREELVKLEGITSVAWVKL